MAYETAEEFHIRMDMSRRGVIIPGSKYGFIDEKGIFYPYTVNVNNSVLNPVYNYYFSKVDKTYGAPSDKQRIRWESGIKKFLARHFLKMYHYKLDLKSVGLQERQYRITKL